MNEGNNNFGRGPIKNIIRTSKNRGRDLWCGRGCGRQLIWIKDERRYVCPECLWSPTAEESHEVRADKNAILSADGLTDKGYAVNPGAKRFRSKWKSRTLTPKQEIDKELKDWMEAGGYSLVSYSEDLHA